MTKLKENHATDKSHTLTVAIYDDEPTVLEQFTAYAEARGIIARPTSSPEDILPWVLRREIDLLISDLRAPYDGLRLLSEARNLDPDLPLVLFSAYHLSEEERASLAHLRAEFYNKRDSDDWHSLATAVLRQPTDEFADLFAKMQAKVERQAAFHRRWVGELIVELQDIADPASTPVSLSNPSFTVADLISGLERMTPEAEDYVSLWLDAKATLRGAGRRL